MTVKSAQEWSGVVVCKDATGALATPSVGPVGALYVNGTANGATVTITGSNPYKWTVTLPALTAGDCVSMYVTATIATIATAAVVAEDVGDTSRTSDAVTLATTQPAITFGKIQILHDEDHTAALTIRNNTEGGYGAYIRGKATGLLLEGDQTGIGAALWAVGDGNGVVIEGTNFNGISSTGHNSGIYAKGTVLDGILASGFRNGIKATGGTKAVEGYAPELARENTLAAIKGVGWDTETLVALKEAIDGLLGGVPLTAQETRDAMKLAPTAGAPAAGSIDDHLDDMPTDVWAYASRTLTQSAASVATAVAGSTITFTRGVINTITLTGLTFDAARTKCWFTVKIAHDDEDTESVMQIEETAGLLYLNGAAASTAADGSLTISGTTATIVLKTASAASLLVRSGMVYDIMELVAGEKYQITEAAANVDAEVTRRTS